MNLLYQGHFLLLHYMKLAFLVLVANAGIAQNKLIIDTSPCEIIGTISNLSWDRDRVLRGENLTHFEYEIRSNDKWVRVEVRDKNGKKAWSNIFVV